MNTIPIPVLTESIAILFKEAYIGPTDDKSPTWFNDNSPDAGIFGQIRGVTAAEASVSADGTGNPGTTISSHLEHLRWSLANVNATFRGLPYNPNWSDSWKVVQVDGSEWHKLCDDLKTEYLMLHEGIQKQETMENAYLLGLIALVPHAAYHLATIRQIKERVHEILAEKKAG